MDPQDFLLHIFFFVFIFKNQRQMRFVLSFLYSHALEACTCDTKFWKSLFRSGYLFSYYLYTSDLVPALLLCYRSLRLACLGGIRQVSSHRSLGRDSQLLPPPHRDICASPSQMPKPSPHLTIVISSN